MMLAVYKQFRICTNNGQMIRNLKPITPQNGRKIVYSSQDTKKVVEQFNKNSSMTLRKAENDKTANPKQMSYSTIKRALNDNNLQAYKVPTIQKINENLKKQRLEFAQKTKQWLKMGILFSDEIFLKRGKIGNKFLWKASRSEIKAEECYQKEKFPKQRLHLWGVIGFEGCVNIQEVKETLNSKTYCKMLQNFIDYVGKESLASKIFQQDQASAHTAQNTKDFLREAKIETLQWPSKGADLSPIEKIQAYLKDEINKEEEDLTNDELFKKVQGIFYQNKKFKLAIKRMYESLPNKIQLVIQKKGNQIDI
ncbi:hypothetical protein ABPG72_010017 [Tetrahymena utriculariae]